VPRKMPYILGEILPQMFISPDNKGFMVYDLLTKYVGLSAQELLPLPWVPPYCGSYVVEKEWKISEKITLGTFEENKKNGVFIEANLQPLIQNLLSKDESAIVAEIGQRIGNLMKFVILKKILTHKCTNSTVKF
jgi:hypothetical protein